MIGRRKSTALPPVADKVKRRVDRIPLADVVDWADNAGAGIARAISDYRREGGIESLLEAREAALAMLGCFESLLERHETRG